MLTAYVDQDCKENHNTEVGINLQSKWCYEWDRIIKEHCNDEGNSTGNNQLEPSHASHSERARATQECDQPHGLQQQQKQQKQKKNEQQ